MSLIAIMGPSNTPELPEEGSKRKTMAEYLASPSALQALYAGNAVGRSKAAIPFRGDPLSSGSGFQPKRGIITL